MEYKLIRSKRKTMSISINENSEIIVKAPNKTSLKLIENFINSKDYWIKEKQKMMHTRRENQKTLSVLTATTLRYMGNYYPTKVLETNIDKARVEFKNEEFIIYAGDELEARAALVKLYKKLALDIVKSRVDYYSPIANVKVANVKISNAKKRWGSCSGKGNINFSWMLTMAEKTLIDYVVVHELSHLNEMNHSSTFYAHIYSILPNYKQLQLELKAFYETIKAEGWQ